MKMTMARLSNIEKLLIKRPLGFLTFPIPIGCFPRKVAAMYTGSGACGTM
jgi:hypothetical protein